MPRNRLYRNFPHAFALLVLVAALNGCFFSTSSEPEKPTRKLGVPPALKLAVVDDRPLGEAILRQWKSRAESPLEVIHIESAKQDDFGIAEIDLIIFPSGQLGEMVVNDFILKIDTEELNVAEYAKRDIFSIIGRREGRWGNATYAIPFGSPQFVLLFRSDIFASLELSPPETWEEYQQLAQRLAENRATAESRPTKGESPDDSAAPEISADWRPVAIPLGEGWAGQTFLAHAAAYARHRNRYSAMFDLATMEPMIAQPPFVRALEEIVAISDFGEGPTPNSPTEAMESLVSGRCAMAWGWPSRAFTVAQDQRPAALSKLAVSELPGSIDVYSFAESTWERRKEEENFRVPLMAISGRLGAVASGSRHPNAALDALLLLAGKEWSRDIASFSNHTAPSRVSHLSATQRWLGRGAPVDLADQYGKVVQSAQNRTTWLYSLRIPGRERYLAALDKAVRQAVDGKATPADALRMAADEWRQITEDYGLQSQQLAYERSLGLE